MDNNKKLIIEDTISNSTDGTTVAAINTTAEVVDTIELNAINKVAENKNILDPNKSILNPLLNENGFVLNALTYGLSDRCPEKLQVDGRVYSKQELSTNEKILTLLISGRSPFVKKI